MLQPAVLYLTPTPRLARSLKRAHNDAQQAAGLEAWHAPAVLTFSAWLTTLRNDYYLSADSEHVPMDSDQALLIWQSIVCEDVFVNMPEIAGLAQQAWRTIAEFNLQPPAQWPALTQSEDSQRFTQWAAEYQSACHQRGLLDEWAFNAQLPALIASGDIDLPATIELAGFDLPPTPLQQDILDAASATGMTVRQPAAATTTDEQLQLHAFSTPDDELRGAARWARAELRANPKARIAIVVPDLTGRVDRVDRLLQQELDAPGFTLQDSPVRPWHISLGKPLHQWPLVTDALNLLALQPERLPQPQITRVLRSPLLPGWDTEAASRNRCLLALARRAPYGVTTNELQFALTENGAGDLADLLEGWLQVRAQAPASALPSIWVQQLQQELDSLGFGNGRSLDSQDYQVLQRWHDLLESVSALDLVSSPLDRDGALRLLRTRAKAVVFRERDAGAAIEVLGVQEALGSRFDALWVTTLDSGNWPGATARNSLIPASVQASVPRATSDGVLQRAQTELQALFAAAPAPQGSYAKGTEEIALTPTALAARLRPQVHSIDVPVDDLPSPARMAEPLADHQAPPLDIQAGTVTAGGTSVLSDQSECPFRAFAKHRLGAREHKLPKPGLDAGQRGTVVHKALELFWREVPDSHALNALSNGERSARIKTAVTSALQRLTRRFRLTLSRNGRALEQQRCERLLDRWLTKEAERPAFRVLTHEQDVTIKLDQLTLSGAVDRVDALESGGHLLIDYKTASTAKTRNSWTPDPRIRDPQLPAYALSMASELEAIAFANVEPQVTTFSGLSREATDIAGISAISKARHGFSAVDDWAPLLQAWDTDLTALAGDYAQGAAAVDPRDNMACKYCHLQGLCRINERSTGAQYAEVDAGDADND